MTYRDKAIYRNDSVGPVSSMIDFMDSGNSVRVNGEIVLRPNVMQSRKFIFERGAVLSNSYPLGSGAKQRPYVNYVLPSITSGSPQKAAARFYDAAADLRINLLQAFAEKQQTVNLVSSSATKIAKSFIALRRGRLSDAVHYLGVGSPRKPLRARAPLADNWLALQYGWKPLLGDIYGAMIATVPRPMLVPIKVAATVMEPVNGTTSKDSEQEYYASYQGLRLTRTTIKADFLVNNTAVREFNSLGLDNPLLLAWELVPYSFVVDWFLPIGNYLESLTALNGLTLKSGSTTNHSTVWLAGQSSFNKNRGYGWPGEVHVSQGTFTIYEKTGSRVLSIPSRPLPRFKNPLSTSHMLSALALLSSAFDQRRRR